MAISDAKSGPVLGFLTVIRDEECGLFGGYLLLNRLGRPLEFHCTAPIRPNRAQEILYGPTLEPFLFGEQIGLTLLRQAKAAAQVVCTDRPPVLSLRELVDTPVALVLTREDNAASDNARQLRIDSAHRGGPRLHVFTAGTHRLAVSEAAAADREKIVAALATLSGAEAGAGALDLEEPFGRIREAIEEARRGGAQR